MSGTNGPDTHQAVEDRIREAHVSGRQLRSCRHRDLFDEVDVFRAASAGLDRLQLAASSGVSKRAAPVRRRAIWDRLNGARAARDIRLQPTTSISPPLFNFAHCPNSLTSTKLISESEQY
jgi:hypothetical protein